MKLLFVFGGIGLVCLCLGCSDRMSGNRSDTAHTVNRPITDTNSKLSAKSTVTNPAPPSPPPSNSMPGSSSVSQTSALETGPTTNATPGSNPGAPESGPAYPSR